MKFFLSFVTNWLEPFSYLVYLVALILFYKYDKTNKIKVLIIYYALAFVVMSAGSYLVGLRIPNLWAYTILFFSTLICIPYFFLQVITSNQKQKIIKFCVLGIGIYFLLRVIFFKGLVTFMSIEYALVYVLIVLMVLMYFDQVLKNVNEEKIFLNFNFWVCTGYLLNFLGGFFVILSYGYLSNKLEQDKIPSSNLHEKGFVVTELWAYPNMLLFLSSIILIFGTLWIIYHKKSD